MVNQANAPKVTVIDPAAPEKAKLRVAAYARVSSGPLGRLLDLPWAASSFQQRQYHNIWRKAIHDK